MRVRHSRSAFFALSPPKANPATQNVSVSLLVLASKKALNTTATPPFHGMNISSSSSKSSMERIYDTLLGYAKYNIAFFFAHEPEYLRAVSAPDRTRPDRGAGFGAVLSVPWKPARFRRCVSLLGGEVLLLRYASVRPRTESSPVFFLRRHPRPFGAHGGASHCEPRLPPRLLARAVQAAVRPAADGATAGPPWAGAGPTPGSRDLGVHRRSRVRDSSGGGVWGGLPGRADHRLRHPVLAAVGRAVRAGAGTRQPRRRDLRGAPLLYRGA